MKLKPNTPRHGMGLMGKATQKAPLQAGTPVKPRAGSVKSQEGRGGKGRMGKADTFKGPGKKLPETISNSQFEKLGA